MVRRDPHISCLFAKVLDPHREGHYTLPDEVIREMKASMRSMRPYSHGCPPGGIAAVRTELLDEVIKAAREGATLPTI